MWSPSLGTYQGRLMGEPNWKQKPSAPASTGPTKAPVLGGGQQVCRGPSMSDARGLPFGEGEKLFTPREGPTGPAHPLKPSASGATVDGSGQRQDVPSDDGPFATQDGSTVSGKDANEVETMEPCERPPDYAAVDSARTLANATLRRLGELTERRINEDGNAQSRAWLSAMRLIGHTPEFVLDQTNYIRLIGAGRDQGDSFIGAALSTSADAATGKVVEGAIGLAATRPSKVGAVARVVAGGIGGFLVGVAGSLVFQAVLSVFQKSEDEKVADVTKRVALSCAKAEMAVRSGTTRALAAWTERQSKLAALVEGCIYPSQLEEVTRELMALEASVPDVSIDEGALTHQILEAWTLQRAGDPESANHRTNPVLWEEAATELDNESPKRRQARGGQWIPREDGRIQNQDLYRRQLLLHLARAGLDEKVLIDKVTAINATAPRQTRYPKPIEHRYDRAKEPKRWAEYVFPYLKYSGYPTTFEGPFSPYVDVKVVLAHDEQGVTWVRDLDFVYGNRVGQTYAEWTETP